MDKKLLGQILATVVLGGIEAGQIALDPQGVAKNPDALADIVRGFYGIWNIHPSNQPVEKAVAVGA